MSFADFLREENEKRRAAFYQHIRPWVAIGAEMGRQSGWRMRYADFKALIELLGGMNSYERRILVPLLDDPGLCELAEYWMGQAGRELGEYETTIEYGDAVKRELAPLLVRRLRATVEREELWVQVSESEGQLWGREIDDLKKSVAAQQKRADRLEEEMASFAGRALTALESVIGDPLKYRPELDLGGRVLAGIEETIRCVEGHKADTESIRRALTGVSKRADEQHERAQAKWRENHELKQQLEAARQQAASWEIQCQDLRDRLVQAEQRISILERERDSARTELEHWARATGRLP